MAQKTKGELKSIFVDGNLVNGGDFSDLVDSLKGLQTAVASPTASGNATSFISSISQNAEGVISVTKKNVDFRGYQTVAGMNVYQENDMQVEGEVTAPAGGIQDISHKMNHYPTVRLVDSEGREVRYGEYGVVHVDKDNLKIELGDGLTDTYKYILD